MPSGVQGPSQGNRAEERRLWSPGNFKSIHATNLLQQTPGSIPSSTNTRKQRSTAVVAPVNNGPTVLTTTTYYNYYYYYYYQ